MLSDLKGIGEVTEKKLNSLSIFTENDLVTHLPKTYLDMTKFTLPQDAFEGDFCFFEAVVTSVAKPFKKGKTEFVRAQADCEGEKINFIWFNQKYILKILKTNEKYRFFGKLKIDKKKPVFYNPGFEEYNGETECFGMRPIYYTKGVIAQKTYRSFVEEALKKFDKKSIIPLEIRQKYKMTELAEAYKNLHFPIDNDLRKFRNRILIEEVVRRICAFRIAQKEQVQAKQRTYDKTVDFTPLYTKLPFTMNLSQTEAVERLKSVFLSDKKINAVLCGDVGSGKTIVAVCCVYFAVKSGYKAAIMAPTEILARQHYNFIKPIFNALGISVCFLSGSLKISERNRLRKEVAAGLFDVIVGTHSVLNVGEDIPDLGFVVMDEQHRFGVAQRTGLISKGKSVDVLTLSATPIPRSMQLVAYGEVEYITIARRYESTVKTSVVPVEKRNDMWKYVSAECEKGKQAYVIAPKIYDAEGVESDSVELLYEELKKIFPDENKIGVLHGKMKADEKQSVLDGFYAGRTSVLVSTTVVEVGIDVPNASIIVITGADRFGLATLHQLRGRVGRNGQRSYCFLYTEKPVSEGLKTLCECNDGFEIAEKDFEMRGGGDVFGLEQSGDSSLKGLNVKLLAVAKEIADGINLNSVKKELSEDIKRFSLGDVSLT